MPQNIKNLITEMRNNKYIIEKQFGDISSFNFSRKAFFNKIWDEQTVKARGLFINTKTNEIALRSYEKFFNINERPETSIDYLKEHLHFPIAAYLKENGFLAMASYDAANDKILLATKSSFNGDCAEWFTDIFYKTFNEKQLEIFKILGKGYTFVFECIDIEHDPHIIEYNESKIILLDLIENNIKFNKVDYSTLLEVASLLDVNVKQLIYTFNNWEEFEKFYRDCQNYQFKVNNCFVEGFVIEDSLGQTYKIKTNYYNVWKAARQMVKRLLKNKDLVFEQNQDDSILTDFCKFIKEKIDNLGKNEQRIIPNIISLRKEFFDYIKTSFNFD